MTTPFDKYVCTSCQNISYAAATKCYTCGALNMDNLIRKIKEDFKIRYDGGYAFSEVENVIIFAIEWTIEYLKSEKNN